MKSHSPKSEAYILSCCVQENDKIDQCLERGISDEFFYTPKFRMAWQAMRKIYGKGDAVDELTLFEAMSDMENVDGKRFLDLCGGPQFVAEVSQYAQVSSSFKTHLDKVCELARGRMLVKVCGQALEMAQDDKKELSDRIANVESSILSISAESVRDGVVDIADDVDHVRERIRKINAGEMAPGISTGYPDIDRVIGSMRKAEMITIAARPGLGKTSLGMNILENVCSSGGSGMVFSLEMTRDQLVQRMLFSRSGVRSDMMNDGVITPQRMADIDRCAEDIKNFNMKVCDDSTLTAQRIQSYARAIHAKNPVDIIVIDYAQIIKFDGRAKSREQEIASISGTIVQLAKELNVPIVLLAQINRESERHKRWPNMSDLRESGAIEQDSHIVLFISKIDKNGEELPWSHAGQEVDIVVAKNRNGRTGSCKLTFLGPTTRFVNHAPAPH